MSRPSQTFFSEILRKEHKTVDDADFVFERIKSFRFFENFFAQNLKTMDNKGLLALCQGFQYERIQKGHFVFKKGDASNNKFYVIISGKVGIVIPKREEVIPVKKPVKEQSSKDSPRVRGGKTQGDEKGTPSTRTSATIVGLDSTPKKKLVYKSIAGPLSFMYTKQTIDQENSNAHEVDTAVKLDTDNPSINENTGFEEEEEEDEDEVEQKQVIPNLDDDKIFEEYANNFGRLVRIMGEGEGFGELALKSNGPRTASVLCKSDCEFLIITKKHFDLVFSKKEREKDEFLQQTLPFLQIPVSSACYNFILCSFKTEVYNKGQYLTSEGKIEDNKAAKLFVIYQGECVVEKNYVADTDNHAESSQPSAIKSNISFQIAVIGKGMMIGEELLANPNTFDFSVKALSDTVIVHSVSKRDFLSMFFQPFHSYILDLYEKKKKQRNVIYENAKKEHESKKPNPTHHAFIQTVKTIRINHMISKSAAQSLNKQLQREQNTLNSVRLGTQGGSELYTEPPPFARTAGIKKSQRPILKSICITETKNQSIDFKTDSGRALPSSKEYETANDHSQFEAVKLFDLEDLPGYKRPRTNKTKSPDSASNSSRNLGAYLIPDHIEPQPSAFSKNGKLVKYVELEALDMKKAKKFSSLDKDYGIDERIASELSQEGKFEPRSSKNFENSPRNTFEDEIQKSPITPIPNSFRNSQVLIRTTTKKSSLAIGNEESSPTQNYGLIPRLAGLISPQVDRSHSNQPQANKAAEKNFVFHRTGFSIGLPKIQLEEDEGCSPNKTYREHEKSPFVSESKGSFPVSARGYGKKSQQTIHLLNTQKWRKQIFQKPPKVIDVEKLNRKPEKKLTLVTTSNKTFETMR